MIQPINLSNIIFVSLYIPSSSGQFKYIAAIREDKTIVFKYPVSKLQAKSIIVALTKELKIYKGNAIKNLNFM